jgi:diadenosine tetraphosphate (Ap4A) HIT family hydrolase
MLGENPSVHIHFHLFPRYGFCNSYERGKWAEEYELLEGEFEWRCFYANPTMNFEYSTGFSYMGEIERRYNDMRDKIGKDPSRELIREMTTKLKEKIKSFEKTTETKK